MPNRLLISSLLSLVTVFCAAQDNNINHQFPDSNGLFKRGLFLQNKNILIPWGVHFKKIAGYGNPKIIHETKTRAQVRWDSVTILDGRRVNVIYGYAKAMLERKSEKVVKTLHVQIDSADLNKIKALLTEYSGVPGKPIGTRNHKYYYWFIDGCNVSLRIYRGTRFYLILQKASL